MQPTDGTAGACGVQHSVAASAGWHPPDATRRTATAGDSAPAAGGRPHSRNHARGGTGNTGVFGNRDGTGAPRDPRTHVPASSDSTHSRARVRERLARASHAHAPVMHHAMQALHLPPLSVSLSAQARCANRTRKHLDHRSDAHSALFSALL